MNILVTADFRVLYIRDVSWMKVSAPVVQVVVPPRQRQREELLEDAKVCLSSCSTDREHQFLVDIIAYLSVDDKASKEDFIGGKFPGLEKFITNRDIMSYSEDDNLCMFATLVYHRHPNEKLRIINVTQEAKQYWKDFEKIKCNNKTITAALAKYEGFAFEVENFYRFCHHFKINVSIFDYENDHYFVAQEYYPPMLYCGPDGEPMHYQDTLNILLVNNNDRFHAMYIKNVENLTGFRFCNICKTFICKRDADHGDRAVNTHMLLREKGLIGVKQIILDAKARPYVPHILKNKAYWYALAHNVEYKPMRAYITYDFETVQVQLDKKITDYTTLDANLVPLSVASCVVTSNACSWEYFDIRTKNWIEKWVGYRRTPKRVKEGARNAHPLYIATCY
jgi:hypothetical protein